MKIPSKASLDRAAFLLRKGNPLERLASELDRLGYAPPGDPRIEAMREALGRKAYDESDADILHVVEAYESNLMEWIEKTRT